MFDLISIGNISIDLYFKGDSLTFEKDRFQLAVGGKYFADEFHSSVGGSGVNVAIGASKHGLSSAVLGIIGENSFKKIILNNLEEHKVSTRLCSFEDKYFNISSILLTPKGERSIVHYSTPHRQILGKNVSIHRLIDTMALFLGNLPDVSLTEREVVLNLCKKNNILTVLNLGVEDCRRPKRQLERLIKKTDVLLINGYEFADLVKAPYKDIHYRENVVKWYIPEFWDKIVIVTDGKKGSHAYYQDEIFFQKAIEVDKIVDSTGAGDGYTAGFISQYLKSKDIEKSLEQGARYAAKILSKIGAN